MSPGEFADIKQLIVKPANVQRLWTKRKPQVLAEASIKKRI